jgi:hypothetical protein
MAGHTGVRGRGKWWRDNTADSSHPPLLQVVTDFGSIGSPQLLELAASAAAAAGTKAGTAAAAAGGGGAYGGGGDRRYGGGAYGGGEIEYMAEQGAVRWEAEEEEEEEAAAVIPSTPSPH